MLYSCHTGNHRGILAINYTVMSEKGNWNQLLQYLCWCVKQDDSEVTCIETVSWFAIN